MSKKLFSRSNIHIQPFLGLDSWIWRLALRKMSFEDGRNQTNHNSDQLMCQFGRNLIILASLTLIFDFWATKSAKAGQLEPEVSWFDVEFWPENPKNTLKNLTSRSAASHFLGLLQLKFWWKFSKSASEGHGGRFIQNRNCSALDREFTKFSVSLFCELPLPTWISLVKLYQIYKCVYINVIIQ